MGLGRLFKQAFFVNQANLQMWLEARPAMTGRQITIAQALADKMKLTPEQIAKACKLGECKFGEPRPARRRSLASSACESPQLWEYTIAPAYAAALRSATSRAPTLRTLPTIFLWRANENRLKSPYDR